MELRVSYQMHALLHMGLLCCFSTVCSELSAGCATLLLLKPLIYLVLLLVYCICRRFPPACTFLHLLLPSRRLAPCSDVVVDEECPVVRPLYECIMAARSRLPGGGKPANASAPAAGKAAMTATQPDPDRRTRNRALLIALPLAIGVPACGCGALHAVTPMC